MAGHIQIRWENESAATPMGQLACFTEFPNLSGLWSRWLESCPLAHAVPNPPSKAVVLGTWMLSMLARHRRYSHVTTIRCLSWWMPREKKKHGMQRSASMQPVGCFT